MRNVLVGFRTDSMRALFGEATAQQTKRVYDRLRNIIKTNQKKKSDEKQMKKKMKKKNEKKM